MMRRQNRKSFKTSTVLSYFYIIFKNMFWQKETFTELENNLITSLAIL